MNITQQLSFKGTVSGTLVPKYSIRIFEHTQAVLVALQFYGHLLMAESWPP
jgi:hypothetical protein